MSTFWKPSSSGEMKIGEGSSSITVIGVSQSDTETVDDYKSKFLEAANNVGVVEEMLLAKWFRDGLREDIKREVRRTKLKDTMEKILQLACEVETRLNETRVPEESKDKEMILCEDEKPEDDEEEDELEDDVEEDPDEDIGDYHRDMRYWDYDDLDDWGVGTPPH